MNKESYNYTQTAMIEASAMVDRLDIEAFLAKISTSKSVGPIIDPTLYRKGIRNLEAIEKLAAAMLQVQRARRELLIAVMETQVSSYGMPAEMGLPE